MALYNSPTSSTSGDCGNGPSISILIHISPITIIGPTVIWPQTYTAKSSVIHRHCGNCQASYQEHSGQASLANNFTAALSGCAFLCVCVAKHMCSGLLNLLASIQAIATILIHQKPSACEYHFGGWGAARTARVTTATVTIPTVAMAAPLTSNTVVTAGLTPRPGPVSLLEAIWHNFLEGSS